MKVVSLGRSGLLSLALGASAGLGLLLFIVYKELRRRREEQVEQEARHPPRLLGDGDLVMEPLDAQEAEAQQEALAAVEAVVQGLSPEQQVELRNRLDQVLTCVASLRSEVADLRGALQDIAVQIIQDVKKGVEDSQRARRRRHVVHRERTESMSSSSVYFTASQGAASLYGGETSEGGYSTANAESDYTDRDTDREEGNGKQPGESEEEDEEERSCATVLTLRQEDSQEEEEEGEEERSCATVLTLRQEDSQEEEDVEEEGEEERLVVDVPSGELALLLAQSDILHTGDAKLKADGLHLLQDHRPQYGESRDFLWRLARAYSDVYNCTTDQLARNRYAEQGREEAEKALKKNGLNAECHKWFAVLTGLKSQNESTHSKLKRSQILKEHLDRALVLKEDDPLCFCLLGRWCYEVATLGWLEKKAAAALYEEPPTSSLHDALENFLKAEELSPGFSKVVRLYIAKCHKELGNTSEAKNWTKLAMRTSSSTDPDDETSALESELVALNDDVTELSPSRAT